MRPGPDAATTTQQQILHKIIVDRHWSMLVISLVVLALSFGLSIDDARVSCWNVELPILCGSRLLFGLECPGCGLTRSFVAFAGGDWSASYTYHRMGWLLFLVVVLQIPYRIFRLGQSNQGAAEDRWPHYFGGVLIAILLGNWAWNVIW